MDVAFVFDFLHIIERWHRGAHVRKRMIRNKGALRNKPVGD